jgi:hypothetical protein
MIPGIPVDHAIAQAEGAAYGEDVLVGGLKATDLLLAVIRTKPGEDPAGLDPSAFTVADGAISSDTEDTDGYQVTVLFTSVGGGGS